MTKQFTTDVDRWQALINRESNSDGQFWYGVSTTGVYCRPVCRSRRPNRSNVRFFETCQQAEQSGFRACKKCRPNSGNINQPHEAVLTACRIIQDAQTPPTLNEIAEAVGLSPHYFHRLFKRTVGVTPKAYATTLRANRLQDGLLKNGTVTSAIYDAGYNNASRCYEESDQQLGMTPSAFKSNGIEQTIRYGTAKCDLGWVVVAATEIGICMIEFGSTKELVQSLVEDRFKNAVSKTNDSEFDNLLSQVVQLVDDPGYGVELPLDVRGTAFQRKVWEILQTIPAGETTTYSDIAQQLGKPKAARAVARAVATNPAAVLIPCHRVIGKDGNLRGYRWGTDRKRQLLEREKDAES